MFTYNTLEIYFSISKLTILMSRCSKARQKNVFHFASMISYPLWWLSHILIREYMIYDHDIKSKINTILITIKIKCDIKKVF